MPMHDKKPTFLFAVVGIAMVLISAVVMMTPTPANAQCGSQASSCKKCHESQAEMPVNNDGTGWHQSHSFGDFCYVCHAGNQQATDKDSAHQGMVSPLEDINASCQQCHVADLEARAQVYADQLGVTVGASTSSTGTSSQVAVVPETEMSSLTSSQGSTSMVVDDPNTTNYAARYDEIVLGKKPFNWGNAILLAMIAVLLLGGGGYVILREKLVSIKFGDTRAVSEEYPSNIVNLLPGLAKLKNSARTSLQNVLSSNKAEKLLTLMDEVVKKDEE